jgi:hypothetical protein
VNSAKIQRDQQNDRANQDLGMGEHWREASPQPATCQCDLADRLL